MHAGAEDGCTSATSPPAPGFEHACTWHLERGEGTFLAAEWTAATATRYHIANEHAATWGSAHAYYHFRVIGESENGEGLTGHLIFTGAETTCTGTHATNLPCPARDLVEERGGHATFTLPAGRYFLLYAFFGADHATLQVNMHTDHALVPGFLQKGETALLTFTPHTTTSDGLLLGTHGLRLDEPAWTTLRHAGGITMQEAVITNEGRARTFTPFAHYPAWLSPSEWGPDVLVDHPNLALAPGVTDFQVAWQRANGATPGFPIVGIVRAPFFLDATGCLGDYGPAEPKPGTARLCAAG